MDIASSLIGLAGGSLGTSLVAWLTSRRRAAGEEQITIVDVAERYWKRIEELETRVRELSQLNAELQIKVARLEAQSRSRRA